MPVGFTSPSSSTSISPDSGSTATTCPSPAFSAPANWATHRRPSGPSTTWVGPSSPLTTCSNA